MRAELLQIPFIRVSTHRDRACLAVWSQPRDTAHTRRAEVVPRELEPMASGFWVGTVPGSQFSGTELRLHPVARLADGTELTGDEITVPLLATKGQELELRPVDATVEVVYDREASDAEGELGWVPVPPGQDGIPLVPVAIAAVSPTEVAILDPTTTRITCLDLTGGSTCPIPLPVMATGDLVTLGDGTLMISSVLPRAGDQELTVMRADPRGETVEIVYHEYPLVVEGFPSVAANTRFTWDAASRTAWVGPPEQDTTNIAPHDPTYFPLADGIHLDAPAVRGPTLTRGALRPDLSADNEASLLDGWSWVRLLDDTSDLGLGVTALEVTDSGLVWLGLAWVNYATGEVTYLLARWQPGQPFAETFEYERNCLEGESRVLAVLDDNAIAVLDANPTVTGARVRLIRFPAHNRLDHGRAGLFADDRPIEQRGVEAGERGWIGYLSCRAPPLVPCSSSDPPSVPCCPHRQSEPTVADRVGRSVGAALQAGKKRRQASPIADVPDSECDASCSTRAGTAAWSQHPASLPPEDTPQLTKPTGMTHH